MEKKSESADAQSVPTCTVTTEQKRQRELEEDAKNSKRYKTLIGSVAEEYVCPITTELPLDPVIAEDGHVYERWAIAECIERQGDDLKSPSTNLPMGPRLTPAVRMRNSIRKLVESGAIEGNLADRWNERIKEEADVADAKRKAEEGDVDAMCDLGDWYLYGVKGLAEDEKQAYQWHKKASDFQSPRGMAEEGDALVHGVGVGKNISYGTALVGIAAGLGSDLGAYRMGEWYMDGENGFPEDNAKAKLWLRKVVDGSCGVKHLWKSGLEDAKDLLEKLDNESGQDSN